MNKESAEEYWKKLKSLDDIDDGRVGFPNGVKPESLGYDLKKISEYVYLNGKEFIDLPDEEKEKFKLEKDRNKKSD